MRLQVPAIVTLALLVKASSHNDNYDVAPYSNNASYWSQLHQASLPSPSLRVAVIISGKLRVASEGHLETLLNVTNGSDVFVVTYPPFCDLAHRLARQITEHVLIFDDRTEHPRSSEMWQWLLLREGLGHWRNSFLRRISVEPHSYYYQTLVRSRTDMHFPDTFTFTQCVGRKANAILRNSLSSSSPTPEAAAAVLPRQLGLSGGIVYALSDAFFYSTPSIFFEVFETMFQSSTQLYHRQPDQQTRAAFLDRLSFMSTLSSSQHRSSSSSSLSSSSSPLTSSLALKPLCLPSAVYAPPQELRASHSKLFVGRHASVTLAKHTPPPPPRSPALPSLLPAQQTRTTTKAASVHVHDYDHHHHHRGDQPTTGSATTRAARTIVFRNSSFDAAEAVDAVGDKRVNVTPHKKKSRGMHHPPRPHTHRRRVLLNSADKLRAHLNHDKKTGSKAGSSSGGGGGSVKLFCGCKFGVLTPSAPDGESEPLWRRPEYTAKAFQAEPAMAYHILSHGASCLPLDLPHRADFYLLGDVLGRRKFAYGLNETESKERAGQ